MNFKEFFQDDIKKDLAQSTGVVSNPNDLGKLVKSLRDQGLIVFDPRNNEGLNYLASLYHHYFPDSGLHIDDEPPLSFGPTRPPPLPRS